MFSVCFGFSFHVPVECMKEENLHFKFQTAHRINAIDICGQTNA